MTGKGTIPITRKVDLKNDHKSKSLIRITWTRREFQYVKEGLKFMLLPFQVQNMFRGLQYHAIWKSWNLHRRRKKCFLSYRPGPCYSIAILFAWKDIPWTALSPKPLADPPWPPNIEIRGWYDTHEGYATGNSPLQLNFYTLKSQIWHVD